MYKTYNARLNQIKIRQNINYVFQISHYIIIIIIFLPYTKFENYFAKQGAVKNKKL